MRYNLRKLSYPKNFIIDLFNHEPAKLSDKVSKSILFPNNSDEVIIYRDKGLKFILSCLTDDELEIIKLKYEEKRSITNIAHKLKVSNSDIEKRIQKIRDKLMLPRRYMYILYDIVEDVSSYELSFDKDLFNKLDIDDFTSLLGLSERTLNALYRNGLYRIENVITAINYSKRGVYWYEYLPHIGRNSAKMITERLKYHGFI